MAANQQEVRVRLSAEGMAEVVSAFQKVSSAGKTAAKDTAGAFGELNRQFGELGKTLLGGLSIAYAADKLKELFSATLESAEQLERLSRQTGLSTDALQAFGRAATTLGLSQEQANGALERFTVATGRAQAGTKQTGQAFTDLGISVKSLQGLNADQKLELVAQKLAGIPDPARRASDEILLFGRTGAEMDQALVKLGQEGFAPFLDRLKELGVYLDSNTLAQLAQTKDHLDDLSTMARGLGTQLIAGLAPALSSVAAELTKATGGGEGFREAGQLIGNVIAYLAAGFHELGIDIANMVADAVTLWNGFATALSNLAHGKIHDALGSIKEAWRQAGEIDAQAKADKARVEADYAAGPTAPKAETPIAGGGGSGPGNTAILNQMAQARLELIRAQLDNELKLFQAHDQLLEAEAKTAYDKGELSLKDYFARRAQILNAEYDKQIAIAQKKLAAEEKLAIDPNDQVAAIQKQAKEEELRGQVADLNAQRQAAQQQLTNELHQQELETQQRQEQAQEKLLTLEGKRKEVAELKLKAETQALDRELAAGGASPQERAQLIGQAQTQGQATIDFGGANTKAQTDLKNLETQKKAIQDQVDSGQLFELTGQQKMLDLEREQLPALQADAKAMLDYANAAKDPQLIASAQAFKEKIDAIGVATNQTAQIMKEMRSGVQDAIGAGLHTLLDDAVTKSKSLGEAFHNAMNSIAQDLEKMALKIAEDKILSSLFGINASGSPTAGGGGVLGGFLGALGFATGGYVRGPGTSTSDSIPILASDKEYIVNARATQQPGVLPLLEAINGMRSPSLPVPRYAAGGYLSAAGAIGAPAAARSPAPAVNLHVSPDALNFTLRDWLEREIAGIARTR